MTAQELYRRLRAMGVVNAAVLVRRWAAEQAAAARAAEQAAAGQERAA